MWDRATLKSRAKAELGISYWQSLCVTSLVNIVPTLAYGILLGLFFGILEFIGYYGEFLTVLAFLAISIAYIIVMLVLQVGKNLFFINAAKGDRQWSYIFLPFTSGKFLQIAGTMFVLQLRIFLWSLLFVIPGIIKSYEYYMVPYIIAENPDMNINEAISISTAMTTNDKFNIFVLNLSFLGWYFLGSCIGGVGEFLVLPYDEATTAQLYGALKYKIGIHDQDTNAQPNMF